LQSSVDIVLALLRRCVVVEAGELSIAHPDVQWLLARVPVGGGRWLVAADGGGGGGPNGAEVLGGLGTRGGEEGARLALDGDCGGYAVEARVRRL